MAPQEVPMAPIHVMATAPIPSQGAPRAAREGARQDEPDAIELLRKRFAKHDRPLAEVRRLVDADMGDRLLSDELRAMRDDA
jgi:hypothetical protein